MKETNLPINTTEPEEKNAIKKTGLPPGSLVYTGKIDSQLPIVQHLSVHAHEIVTGFVQYDEIDKIPTGEKYTWVDVRGLSNISLIENLGNKFGIHWMWMEDILNVHQIAKFDDLEGNCFISIPFMSYNTSNQKIEKEQITIFFNEKIILSFQEMNSDTFLLVKERMWNNAQRYAQRHPDYIAYCLLDLAVDKYLEVVHHLNEKIDNFEFQIERNPNTVLKKRIYHYRRDCTLFSRDVLPIREVVLKFKMSISPAVHKDLRIYLTDLYDHAQQLTHSVEVLKDNLYNLTDLFHSEINYKTNIVIKTLTVITAIFIPLTFIVGVYGMNFKYMPELSSPYGYYGVWIIMILIALIAFIIFKVKKWI